MKEKNLKIGLVLTATLGILLCIIGISVENVFTSMVAFPFEQVGLLLRWLSLSSVFGNILAIILYCVISLIPMIFFYLLCKTKKNEVIDIMLVFLSLALFGGLYLMINPSLIGRLYNNSDFILIGKSMIGLTIYSIFLGYIIFKFLNKVDKSKTDSILNILRKLLIITAYIFVIKIFWISLIGLIKSFDTLKTSNMGTEDDLLLSYVFLVLQYLVNSVPYYFNVLIIISSIKIIDLLKESPFTEEVSIYASKTVDICRKSILWVVISQIFVNLIQLGLGSNIRNSNYTLTIPIFSVIFVLVTMLFSKYFEEARKIKDDNDMII